MRQETNNEMDLLLRRLGRQQETSASSDHLDADELSSYAENVLPPAARARYTEHLAECSRCRDLVVQLSSSAGVVVAHETAKVFEPSALRKFLASLFSPMVLRFAVPALGIVIVATIGFIVSRNEGTVNAPVAEVREQQPVQVPIPATQPQPSSSPEPESRAFFDNRESTNKAVTQDRGDTKTGAAPASNASPAVAADVPQDTTAKKVDELQPVAKEAPPPAKPTPVISGLKKLEAQQRKQDQEQTVTVTNEPAVEKTTDEARREDRSPRGVAAARAKRAEAAGVVAPLSPGSVQRDGETDKDKNEADTRTVAGRRFRKQGNVWIDTAYKSQGLTELTRGTEQYRALVADEPEIKQIADQLGGEIIVVWKGRAYRVR